MLKVVSLHFLHVLELLIIINSFGILPPSLAWLSPLQNENISYRSTVPFRQWQVVVRSASRLRQSFHFSPWEENGEVYGP